VFADTITTSQIGEMVKGDKLASEAFERVKTHLVANGVDLEQTTPTVGPWLTFDPKAERFTGTLSEEANKLVKREYRAPYVIPDQV